ncbi:hypothetical protein DEH84_06990 [Aquabacterium olei]|uniref:Uncharacterized protein n=1 Tax=Aquabacterium olei TaxID=1296669 RepID=A0A2U8FQ64_9BURK|nr:hypothetical protein [Aquabacterium olei]AWI53202.1 hypothetical protein DEH84_06990 [Aquabacterium olei]
MATYDLTQNASATVLEVLKPQLAYRYERHVNVLAQGGLAVGDTVYFDVDVPDWCRTIVASKRTNTANADTLTVTCVDSGPAIQPMLAIKTASQVQTGGSTSSAAASSVMMQLYPVGKKVRIALTLATSVPAQCVLSVSLYDL